MKNLKSVAGKVGLRHTDVSPSGKSHLTMLLGRGESEEDSEPRGSFSAADFGGSL